MYPDYETLTLLNKPSFVAFDAATEPLPRWVRVGVSVALGLFTAFALMPR